MKMTKRLFRRADRPGVASAIAFAALAATAAAGDPSFITRDGRRVPLARSTDEVGVMLRHADDIPNCRDQMARNNLGQLREFNDNPDCRLKILRLNNAAATRRDAILREPAVVDVRPVYRFQGFTDPAVTTGTLLVRVQKHLTGQQRTELWDDYGVQVIAPIEDQQEIYQLAPIVNDEEDVSTAEAMATDPRVVWAQPNLRRRTQSRQISISDGFFGRQWHLSNTGQSGGTSDADIDAPEAWAIAEGQDILFSMFDDSCDVEHEDLRDGYIGRGQDASLGSTVPGADDPRPKRVGDNHGTRVMGLAVAKANSIGGRGVSHLSRFTASRGLSEALTDAEIASAYRFARQQAVDVHINSWGFSGGPNPAVVEDEIALAFNSGRNKGNLDDIEGEDPLGMVILFATGNANKEVQPGFDLSTLSTVIGVGGTNDFDRRVVYSNFGSTMDITAPTSETFEDGIFTTDNTDRLDAPDLGSNVGGTNQEIGLSEPDSTGSYTNYFNGTSAACPIASGVAGLILSANPLLTATDVRLIMVHSADRVTATEAEYDRITGHSRTYGYGRVNALRAVEAARTSANNNNRTWPGSPADVVVSQGTLRWRQNVNTEEFLILQADADFSFIPEDGKCYSSSQITCAGRPVETLPVGVSVLAVGCRLSCQADQPTACVTGQQQCIQIPSNARNLALYGFNGLGLYSFGVAATSSGAIRGSGVIPGEDSSDGGGTDGGGTRPDTRPAITIAASPLEGVSPLTVGFMANAASGRPIDETRTQWDFDVDDGILVDSTVRNSAHTYTVGDGEVRTIIAELRMSDVDGNTGFSRVAIQVQGARATTGGPVTGGDFNILVGSSSNPGANISEGKSPLSVLLSVEASSLPGTLQSISWDLGDGERSNSITVPHTYVNQSDSPIRVAISSTVTTVTSGGTSISSSATKLLTVTPGEADTDPGNPNLPGTGVPGTSDNAGSACGSLGLIPLLAMVSTLTLLRRRR